MPKKRQRQQILIGQSGIGAILKTYRLNVPPHQREYRWTSEHVERLFEDLQKAMSSDEPEYFLGSIVTIPDTEGVLEVIDGQQRLATVTILLSQIRRYLEPIEPKLARSLDSFLTEYDRQQRSDVPKLKLNLSDNEYFSKLLVSNVIPDPLPTTAPVSHKRLRNAFAAAETYVKKIVAPASSKAHADELNKWVDFIESSAEVILLRVPSGANAYKMFETLNDRGLKTTQADLVKNYLFSKAEDRYQEAQAAWSSITGALSSLQGDDDERDDKEDVTVIFLRAALICISGFIRRNAVYDTIQAAAKGRQTVISTLKELESLSATYEATFFQDNERWKKYPDAMAKAIQTINEFDIKPFRPALLALSAKFSAKDATLAFEFFVSLGVRLIIASSTRSGTIEETLARIANRVFLGEIASVLQLKAGLADITPSDEMFSQAFQTATVSKTALARYYLRAMERVAQNQQLPWFVPNEDKEAMTLEHVLPEKTMGNWPGFTDEQADAFYRRIGNLCLLPRKLNSDLGSADWKTKKAVYKSTPYALTKQIAEAKDWTSEAITTRQVGLAKQAIKTWPI